MSHRYFSWREEGVWRKHFLLSFSQIAELLPSYIDKYEVFTSISVFNENGTQLYCPFYLDFDGDTAYNDAQYAVYLIQEAMNVTPNIYYSGGKGFHVIIPYKIQHKNCNYIAKAWAVNISPQLTIDTSVYAKKSMWRLNKSKGSKKGYFKTQITPHELFNLKLDQIKEIAKTRRDKEFPKPDTSKIPEDIIQDAFDKHINYLPRIRQGENLKVYKGKFTDDMTPCLLHLMRQKPLQGNSNNAIFILARFAKYCDLNYAQAFDMIMTNKYLAAKELDTAEPKKVTRVLNYIYAQGLPSFVGCKGNDVFATYLRNFCEDECHFNDNCPSILQIIGKSNGTNSTVHT